VVTRLINEVLAFDDISVEEGEKVKLWTAIVDSLLFIYYMDLRLPLLSLIWSRA
jgi:hypothetical protein